MDPKETSFNIGARACLTELISLLSDRIGQVDRDSREYQRDPGTSAAQSQVAFIESTGTIDALRWTIARVEELRARYGAS